MSVFHHYETDTELEWRTRDIRNGNERAKVRSRDRTTTGRPSGQADERNPNKTMRLADRTTVTVRRHRQSSQVRRTRLNNCYRFG